MECSRCEATIDPTGEEIFCEECGDRIAELEIALRECARELRATNRQLLDHGFNEGMTVTNALSKSDALLNR